MTIENFTPYSALIGGLLIGLSAAILMFFNGRVAGISGILAGISIPKREDGLWRFFFMIGLILGPVFFKLFDLELPAIELSGEWMMWFGAGLLVGYGTQMGSGCTSGHGVCGLARLSLRSLAATLTFMFVAGLIVFLMRHVFTTGV